MTRQGGSGSGSRSESVMTCLVGSGVFSSSVADPDLYPARSVFYRLSWVRIRILCTDPVPAALKLVPNNPLACLLLASVPDPDTPGSEIILPQGSGSEIINFGSESESSPFSH